VQWTGESWAVFWMQSECLSWRHCPVVSSTRSVPQQKRRDYRWSFVSEGRQVSAHCLSVANEQERVESGTSGGRQVWLLTGPCRSGYNQLCRCSVVGQEASAVTLAVASRYCVWYCMWRHAQGCFGRAGAWSLSSVASGAP